MGRKKKADVDKSISTTISLSPKHTFMLQTIMDVLKKGKSEIIQDQIEENYKKNCSQGSKHV